MSPFLNSVVSTSEYRFDELSVGELQPYKQHPISIKIIDEYDLITIALLIQVVKLINERSIEKGWLGYLFVQVIDATQLVTRLRGMPCRKDSIF